MERCDRDAMVLGFTTTCAISAYHHQCLLSSKSAHGGMYSIQHYVITCVSDLGLVGGYLHH